MFGCTSQFKRYKSSMITTASQNILSQPSPHQRSNGVGHLSVKRTDNATRIAKLYQEGCAKIRIPSSSSDNLQAIMINSSGGITGGDRLEWKFELQDETALTVTSQACERVYASSHDVGKTDISIAIGKAAKLAWLPQETILFNNGAFHRTIDIEMEKDAELLMVEPIVFGRKAMGECVVSGTLKDSWRIRRSGSLLHAEEAFFEGDIHQQLCSRSVAAGQVAMASLLLIGDHAESVVCPAREIVGRSGGVSFWNGKLLARIITQDSYSLRKKLVPLIRLMNRDANMPKVWAL